MQLHFSTGLRIVPQHLQRKFVIATFGSTFNDFAVDSQSQNAVCDSIIIRDGVLFGGEHSSVGLSHVFLSLRWLETTPKISDWVFEFLKVEAGRTGRKTRREKRVRCTRFTFTHLIEK